MNPTAHGVRQDAEEKAAAVAEVQKQAADLAAKLAASEAALERSAEVCDRATWSTALPPIPKAGRLAPDPHQLGMSPWCSTCEG